MDRGRYVSYRSVEIMHGPHMGGYVVGCAGNIRPRWFLGGIPGGECCPLALASEKIVIQSWPSPPEGGMDVCAQSVSLLVCGLPADRIERPAWPAWACLPSTRLAAVIPIDDRWIDRLGASDSASSRPLSLTHTYTDTCRNKRKGKGTHRSSA